MINIGDKVIVVFPRSYGEISRWTNLYGNKNIKEVQVGYLTSKKKANISEGVALSVQILKWNGKILDNFICELEYYFYYAILYDQNLLDILESLDDPYNQMKKVLIPLDIRRQVLKELNDQKG